MAMRHVWKLRTGGFWFLVLGLLFGSMAMRSSLAAQNAPPVDKTVKDVVPVTDKDALPVMERCFRCHGADLQMSGLDLRSRDSMLKGGKSGPAIVPGNADDSLLMKRVTAQIKPQMPMAPLAPLTGDEIAILKAWIDQGVTWTTPTPVDVTSATPAPAAATGPVIA